MYLNRLTVTALIVGGIAFTGCGSESESTPEDKPQAAAQTKDDAAPQIKDDKLREALEDAKTPKPASKNDRLRDALANAEPAGAGKVDVQKIEFGKSLSIYLTTPEGGFSGPSDKDLNNSAAATFKAVYGEAKYPATRETVIVFRGGLVNSETGKDLPDANTSIYTMKGSEARDIDWSDDDAITYNIDWSNYRDFIHPAIKQD